MLRGELYFFSGLTRLRGDTGMEIFSRERRKGVREFEFGNGSVHRSLLFSGQETIDETISRVVKNQNVGVKVLWLCVRSLH